MSTIRSVFLNCTSNCSSHFKTLFKGLAVVTNSADIRDQVCASPRVQPMTTEIDEKSSLLQQPICLIDLRQVISPPKDLRNFLNLERDYEKGAHFSHSLDVAPELQGQNLEELQTVCSEAPRLDFEQTEGSMQTKRRNSTSTS